MAKQTDYVVMLVNEYPPLRVGGAEKQAERLSKYLVERGWQPCVITRGSKGLLGDELRDGIRILRPLTVGPGKLKTISFVLGALWQLWLLRDHYQILHAHLAFGPALAAVIASRFLGKNTIVKLGNSGEFGDILTSKTTWRGRMRLSAIRQWADIVIVLDDAMKEEAITAGFHRDRIRKMSNGIDAKSLSASSTLSTSKYIPLPDHKTIAIFVGRLTKQKSITTVLQALSIAAQSCPSLHLVLLGDGPERSALEDQVTSLAINEHVTFAGYQENVESYLRGAHIFVLPSLSEGISNALLEAMSYGLPCLASSVGGNVEVLDHGKYGILLPPNDVHAWAGALEQMAAVASLRLEMGELARQRILQKYDFAVIGKKYEELYEELYEEVLSERRII
jgi:glycosyltransferase involved in cell wall biosynthesis